MSKKIIGAGLLAIDKQTGKILLGRRGLDGDSPNTFAPFGGTFEEKDIIPKTTAKREFAEETCCSVPYKISTKPYYINDDNFVRFYTYIGIFEKQFPVVINNESLGFGWFDLEHLPENMHEGVKEMFNSRKNQLKKFITKIQLK